MRSNERKLVPASIADNNQFAPAGIVQDRRILILVIGKAQPGPVEASDPIPTPDLTPASFPTRPPDSASPPGSAAEPAVGDDGAWIPPRYAVPFGPFLVAGALEWLWFSPALARALPIFGVFR